VHDQREMNRAHEGDWRKVPERIVGKLHGQDGIDHVGGVRHQQGMAVGRALCDEFSADVAVPARPVVDHRRLPQARGQSFRGNAREEIVAAALSQGNDDTNRPRRIALRSRRGRGKRRAQEK
jgi:hypothetical protein